MSPDAGRVLVITGASTGIGAATAAQAVEAGWRVVLASRSRGPLEGLAGSLGGPETVLAVPCDVTDWADQARLKAMALEAYGRVDAMFANAGLVKGSPILGGEDSPDGWREIQPEAAVQVGNPLLKKLLDPFRRNRLSLRIEQPDGDRLENDRGSFPPDHRSALEPGASAPLQ